jgi:hypothetical protein
MTYTMLIPIGSVVIDLIQDLGSVCDFLMSGALIGKGASPLGRPSEVTSASLAERAALASTTIY